VLNSPSRLKPNIVTYWSGVPRTLPPLYQLCLASQVKLGYRVTVFSHEPVAGLPANVENEDAASILPISVLERLAPPNAGNWNLLHFSDFFRMRLLHLGRGLWLDTDVFLFREFDIDPNQPYFGWESRSYIGSAILYLPPRHPIVIDYARMLASPDLLPDWLSPKLRFRKFWWDLTGRRYVPAELGVLMYGPLALTQLAKRHGCIDKIMGPKAFYAHSKNFFDPIDVEAVINDPEVIGIHIKKKGRASQPPVPGSLYDWALRQTEGAG
jgi:hypothetical protein